MQVLRTLCLLFFFNLAFGQWEIFPLEGISQVNGFWVKGDTCYALVQGGLLRSINRGIWQTIPFPDGQPLSMAQTQQGKFLIGAGGGLYVGDGQTWERLPLNQRFIGAVNVTSDGVILAAVGNKGTLPQGFIGSGSVFVSRDGGWSWTNVLYEINSPGECLSLEIASSGFIFLTSTSGIYQGNPNAMSWTRMSPPANTTTCRGARLSPDGQYLNALFINSFTRKVALYARPVAPQGTWVEIPGLPVEADFWQPGIMASTTGYRVVLPSQSSSVGLYSVSLSWQGNVLTASIWNKIFDTNPPFSHSQGWLLGDGAVRTVAASGNWLWAATQSSIYLSESTAPNAPDNWILTRQQSGFTAVNGFAKAGDTVMVATQGLPISADNGQNWIASMPANSRIEGVMRFNGQWLAYGEINGQSGLYIFQTGRWQLANLGLPTGRISTLMVYRDGLLAAVESRGVFQIQDIKNPSAVSISTGTTLAVNTVNFLGEWGDTLFANVSTGSQPGVYRGFRSGNNWNWTRVFGTSVRGLATSSLAGKRYLFVAANWSAATPLTPAGGDLAHTQVALSQDAGRNWRVIFSRGEIGKSLPVPKDYAPLNNFIITGLAAFENRAYVCGADLQRSRTVCLAELVIDDQFATAYSFDFLSGTSFNPSNTLSINKESGVIWLEYSPAFGQPARRAIKTDIPTGFDNEDDFLVYPNPASQWLCVKNSKKGLLASITDLAGKLLIETQEISSAIWVGSLSPGIYVLRIQNSIGQTVCRRFIKQ